jgi:hypothetical protein
VEEAAVKRWHYICETGSGPTIIKTEVQITQRDASDLVRAHVEGIAGLRCEADAKIKYAASKGEAIALTKHSRLEYREVSR